MIQKIVGLTDKAWFWMLFCVVLYANTFNHGYVIDDQIVITNNSLTQKGVTGIPEIFAHSYLYGYDGREDESYRPVTLSTFALERSLFDANSAISHVIQVLLYGLTILVLYKMLVSVFGNEKKGLISIVVFLFAVHPIHTEVVANVKSRDELLCALFLFASIYQYSKWMKGNQWKNLLATLAFYFLATLSKETAIPAILLFPVMSWYLSDNISLKVIYRSLLLIIPLAAYALMRVSALSDVLIQDPIDPVANSLALAQNSTELFSSNLSIFAKYIQLAIFPVTLSWDYSLAQLPINGFASFPAILGLIALVALVILSIVGLVKKKIYGFGAVFFILSFVATSNFFFLINCPLGERFLFMPVLGLLLIVVPALDSFANSEELKKIALAMFVIIAGYFSVRTIVRSIDWKNNQSIYEAGIIASPNSVKTHFNLGTEYITQGNLQADSSKRSVWYEKSLKSLKNAENIYPAYVNIYENQAYAYAELSKLTNNKAEKLDYLLKGKRVLEHAIDSMKFDKKGLYTNQTYILSQLIANEEDTLRRKHYLLEIVKLVSGKNAYDAEDFHQEIYALSELKRFNDVLNLTEKKGLLFPEKAELVAEMSRRAFARNDFEMSYKLLVKYLEMNPNDLSSLSNKGMLLEILGKKEEAKKVYEEVLAKDPNQEHARQLYEKLKLSK